MPWAETANVCNESTLSDLGSNVPRWHSESFSVSHALKWMAFPLGNTLFLFGIRASKAQQARMDKS